MKLRFLQTPAEVDAELPQLLALLERLPPVDEYQPAQLFELARRGSAHIGRFDGDDGQLAGVIAFEFIQYPSLLAVNIIALAGERLDEIAADLFENFKAFARLSGADTVEALCGDAMARMLKRYGFSKTNNQVRVRL